MKEKEFIGIIKSVTGSGLIGDDCAYLKDLGIVITQDSMVEDVHFRRDWITSYQLGRKAVMVNISDVCASGAKPLYATIALSLPQDIDGKFIKEFFKGACSAGVEIVGGDITGADKIFISVTAIGSTAGRRISSRSGAQVGQKVVVSGEHGSSGAGLMLLQARHCEEPATKQSHSSHCEEPATKQSHSSHGDEIAALRWSLAMTSLYVFTSSR